MYRPFVKQWLYFNRRLNEMVYQMPKLFPTAAHENIVISATGSGATKEFSVLATSTLPDLDLEGPMFSSLRLRRRWIAGAQAD
jgi:predicted helicase